MSAPASEAQIIAVGGDLELGGAAPAFAPLFAAAASPDRRPVVLDLSEVAFVDSTGLRALMEAREAFARGGQRLEIVCPPGGAVATLLALTSLDATLRPHPDLERALAAV